MNETSPASRTTERAMIAEIDRLSGTTWKAQPRETSVATLLALEGEAFVRALYESVFGREADPDGLAHHMKLLASGTSKITLIKSLHASHEGKVYGSTLIDVPSPQRRFGRLYTLPVIGRLFRIVAGVMRIQVLRADLQGLHQAVVGLQKIMEEQRDAIGAIQQGERRLATAIAELKNALLPRVFDELSARLDVLEQPAAEPWSEPLLMLADRQETMQTRLDTLGNEALLRDLVGRLCMALEPLSAEAGQGETGWTRIARAAESLRQQEGRIRNAERLAAASRDELTDQRRRLSLLLETVKRETPLDAGQIAVIDEQQDHLLDALYVEFEARFRGSREMIRERQRAHLPLMIEAGAGTPARKIVDVGAGRGEWLELLKSEGLDAVGVDSNEAMVSSCRELGLDCIIGDAVAELAKLPAGSVGAVTGFHIIEHLPFRVMVALFDECVRVLATGGVVLFETPNPANLQVASRWFYLDPTHRNPLPGEMVAMIAEARGLSRVRIQPLHPADGSFDAADQALGRQLDALFYGPQDYALIGSKA